MNTIDPGTQAPQEAVQEQATEATTQVAEGQAEANDAQAEVEQEQDGVQGDEAEG